jgi:hypothetical protein
MRAAGWRGLLALLLALGGLAATPLAPAGAISCTVMSTADSGSSTLRARLADANCDAITFDLAAMGTGTITLLSQLPAINRNLTITGPGRDLLTLDGGNAVRPLAIIGGAVTVTDLTVARGRVTALDGVGAFGACAYIGGGTVTLRDLRVRDCRAVGQAGGGLFIAGGTTLLERAEVRGNEADFEAVLGGGGGGLFVDQFNGDTSVTICDSVIAGNRALNGSRGGGLHLRRLTDRPSTNFPYGLTVTIERSTIGGTAPADANAATDDGGGLYSRSATAIVTNATIRGNTAMAEGGGI